MKNFQNSRHIREGISNLSHTRGGMSRNDVGMEILYNISGYAIRRWFWITSGLIRGPIGTFWLHSSGNRKHSNAFQLNSFDIEIDSGSNRDAFRLIRGAFGTFWHDLKWHAVSILPRRRSECFECCWNAVTARMNIYKCSQSAVRIHFECRSIFLHFECTSNVLSMSKAFGPATRIGSNIWNALRMQSEFFRMHFEYPGMYKEFSFRRHSGSFRL